MTAELDLPHWSGAVGIESKNIGVCGTQSICNTPQQKSRPDFLCNTPQQKSRPDFFYYYIRVFLRVYTRTYSSTDDTTLYTYFETQTISYPDSASCVGIVTEPTILFSDNPDSWWSLNNVVSSITIPTQLAESGYDIVWVSKYVYKGRIIRRWIRTSIYA